MPQVRYANILSQAASLLASNLVDETFMTEEDVKFDNRGTRLLGELNRGKLWERTVKHKDFPKVSPNILMIFQIS